MFETTDVNQCPGAYTCEKFLNFCIGVLQAPKNWPQKLYFGWGACYQHTAQTAQFWVTGIISPSRHPKDVPFYASFDGGCMVWVL